jgi:hypothetical protein
MSDNEPSDLLSSYMDGRIPSSAMECFADDGSLDTMKYFLYLRQKRQKRNNDDIDAILDACFESAEMQPFPKGPKKKGIKRTTSK